MGILNNSHSQIYDPATRRVAMTVGILFLTATITFLMGDSLIQEFFTGSDDTGQLTMGVALQAMCGMAVVGTGLALRRPLGRFHQGLANGYLALRGLECAVIVTLGAYMVATTSSVPHHDVIIYLFTGIGGVIVSYLLCISKLVPVWLSWLGMVGYMVLLLAVPVEFLGIARVDSGPGMLFYVPGGLFEVIMPILLIIRGFRLPEVGMAGREAALAGTGMD